MADAGGHPDFTPKINPETHSAKIVLCGALMLPPVTMMAALGIYNRVRLNTLFQVDSLVTLLGAVCYTTAQSSNTRINLTVRLPDPSCWNVCDVCSCHESRLRAAHYSSNKCTA